MRLDAVGEISGHADVERFVALARQDINGGLLHAL
jgi:hypothetical protein